jgi:hypothetical protein
MVGDRRISSFEDWSAIAIALGCSTSGLSDTTVVDSGSLGASWAKEAFTWPILSSKLVPNSVSPEGAVLEEDSTDCSMGASTGATGGSTDATGVSCGVTGSVAASGVTASGGALGGDFGVVGRFVFVGISFLYFFSHPNWLIF